MMRHAFAMLFAVTAAAPALAQPPASPERTLAALVRQDADLRARIGRMQLDALVSRVDRTFAHKSAVVDHAASDSGLRRQLDLYTF